MKAIGILGSGQLAQLLAHAAYQLGVKTLCYSAEAEAPAARMSPLFIGTLSDEDSLTAFAKQVDVITLENENIPDVALDILQQHADVLPGKAALTASQDRWHEKSMFTTLDIPVPTYTKIDSLSDLKQALNKQACPAILKTRRFGYDGKGQFRVESLQQVDQALNAINHNPAILESFVTFDAEVSQIAARNHQGDIVYYPLIKNHHDAGILRTSTFPYQSHSLGELAQEYTRRVMTHLDYVGVMTFEFFVCDDKLLANEIAPRVHNSGHLTIEGTQCSQFENHLRAIAHLPLVEPQTSNPVQMENIIGTWPDGSHQKLEHVYNYGKTPRKGRKLGHRVWYT